ncbi:MAG: hypothetical protein R6V04_05345, partial [bacterium]
PLANSQASSAFSTLTLFVSNITYVLACCKQKIHYLEGVFTSTGKMYINTFIINRAGPLPVMLFSIP